MARIVSHKPSLHGVRVGDRGRLFAMLEILPRLYPNGLEWLDRRFDEALLGRGTITIAAQGPRLCGVVIDAPKGARQRKLCTVFVDPRNRGHGLGSLLLWHTFERWLREGVEKAWVTAAKHDNATGTFLATHCFDIFDTVGDLYGPGRSETVMQWNPDVAENVVTHLRQAFLLRGDTAWRQAG